MDAQAYTVTTRYGTLVAKFQAADYLWITTSAGADLVVNGVKYDVQASFHSEGSCISHVHAGDNYRRCHAHYSGAIGWQYGRVKHHDERDHWAVEGELDGYTLYPTIRRHGGGEATDAARRAIYQALLPAVAAMVRTVPNGPEQARIRILNDRYVALLHEAQNLRNEADAKEAAAAAIRALLNEASRELVAA